MTDLPKRDHATVLVVGSGPVGLSTALAVRARGLGVTVLEAEPRQRTRVGSRAIFVHRESLLHLEQAYPGLGWKVARAGLVWSTKRTFWGDRQVYERTYPVPDPRVLPHSTNLAQADTERLLLDACLAAGVEFAWDREVTHVAAGPDGVSLATRAGRDWTADYVVGADGARSAVRSLLQIPMEGTRSERSFVVVDVSEDGSSPRRPERVFYYRHPAVGGRNVLLVPFAGGWRADLQCRLGDDPDDFAQEHGVRRWVEKVLSPADAELITWVSSYRFLQVVARNFADQHRRVLLVGEAAHLFAPFGARGMNSGIADAAAAAAAIGDALTAPSREAAVAAVDGFAVSRRAAALYNRDAAGLALSHMQGTRLRAAAMRRAAVAVAVAGQRAGAWLDAAPYGPRARARRGPPGTY